MRHVVGQGRKLVVQGKGASCEPYPDQWEAAEEYTGRHDHAERLHVFSVLQP